MQSRKHSRPTFTFTLTDNTPENRDKVSLNYIHPIVYLNEFIQNNSLQRNDHVLAPIIVAAKKFKIAYEKAGDDSDNIIHFTNEDFYYLQNGELGEIINRFRTKNGYTNRDLLPRGFAEKEVESQLYISNRNSENELYAILQRMIAQIQSIKSDELEQMSKISLNDDYQIPQKIDDLKTNCNDAYQSILNLLRINSNNKKNVFGADEIVDCMYERLDVFKNSILQTSFNSKINILLSVLDKIEKHEIEKEKIKLFKFNLQHGEFEEFNSDLMAKKTIYLHFMKDSDETPYISYSLVTPQGSKVLNVRLSGEEKEYYNKQSRIIYDKEIYDVVHANEHVECNPYQVSQQLEVMYATVKQFLYPMNHIYHSQQCVEALARLNEETENCKKYLYSKIQKDLSMLNFSSQYLATEPLSTRDNRSSIEEKNSAKLEYHSVKIGVYNISLIANSKKSKDSLPHSLQKNIDSYIAIEALHSTVSSQQDPIKIFNDFVDVYNQRKSALQNPDSRIKQFIKFVSDLLFHLVPVRFSKKHTSKYASFFSSPQEILKHNIEKIITPTLSR